MVQGHNFCWSRDSSYSIVVHDHDSTVLYRLKGIAAASSTKVLEEQKMQHQSYLVTLHLDMQADCTDCDGTGVRHMNKKLLCPVCEGRGAIVTNEIGPEVPQA
jgi:RecJ-like exonuclease